MSVAKYMSKVFDETYTPDVDEPYNAGRVIKGGTGYGLDNRLPPQTGKEDSMKRLTFLNGDDAPCVKENDCME